ncbi:MAG: methyltransferase domain-containing protein [Oscillospiraceae bacterium]|nr:methyltransferase domain-containing protein [Oscillospiraceae bacterium]
MDYDVLWPGGPKYIQEDGVFPLGSDSAWLGAFVNLSGVKRFCDLGCGGGALSFNIMGRAAAISGSGIDISERAVRLAEKNAALNGFDYKAVCGDIRNIRDCFSAGSFDLVVSNPPYFPEGSGKKASEPQIAAARQESACSLKDICAAAAFLCRWGGRFAIVYRPERLSELFCAMSAAGIEPKRLRLVLKDHDSAPTVCLAEGRRGGAPGLSVEPPLYIRQEGR